MPKYEVTVRENHVVVYTVEAKDEEAAMENYPEDNSPVVRDIMLQNILEVKEVE